MNLLRLGAKFIEDMKLKDGKKEMKKKIVTT